MVEFGKFVHSKSGNIIMSILLGFGLATLFRSVCKDKECVIFHAPPLEEIKDKIYKFDNKCYKYVPVSTKCDSSKKILGFS
jgi:hypothetical protein